MAGESVPEGLDLKEKGEEELWELINDNRHRISLGVRPCIVIPYLRQARVLTEMDEDEILSSHNLTNRSMRTSHMMDILRTQGRNGAVALLESLMIHYPTLYTQVTGCKPSSEPSRFSGLIKYSELTEYLIRAVTAMQNELQEARSENGKMNARCASLESEIQLVVEREENSRRLQAEYERLQRHVSTLQREVTNLKDEKCDLYMRYTAAIEEKSAMNIRLHDLNLQTYQLQTELQKAQTENVFQKRRSLRCVPLAETSQLQQEVRTLRFQLTQIEKLNPVQQAILPHDVIDSQAELGEKLRCSREENEKLHKEKQDLLDQSESLTVQVHQLTLDCNMHQKKSTVIQNQMRELQTERDQAFLSRNEAQIQIASILAEKDTLRSQIMELKKAFSLQDKDRQSSDVRGIACKCDDSPIPNRRKLCRMDAVNPSSQNCFYSKCDNSMASSEEPPSPQSLHIRKGALHEENSLETVETDDLSLDDFVILRNVLNEGKETSTQFVPGRTKSIYSLDKNSVPPFLVRSRPKAIRISGRVVTISFKGDALPSQIVVAGGNKTGVFVHQVTEGSAAHTAGVSHGAQIVEVKYQQNQKAIRVVLEDSTLEEAMWALGQVTDFCHLSLRPRQDDYEALLQQLQNDKMSSGDSFYVRVNVTIPAGPKGTMAVSCNDILHVTNTRPANTDDSWYASQVDAYKLLAHQSRLVPNYYRAQRLLIRAIEEMNFQTRKSEKEGHVVAQNTRKAVRIVSTCQQGRNPLWVSVENEKSKSTESGETSAPRSCMTLMPYTLVTPHFPPICRPVLLLPSILGRILENKVASWQGFELCEPVHNSRLSVFCAYSAQPSSCNSEMLSPSDHSGRLNKSQVLEECGQGSNCCYTLQSVEKVMKKGIHCVLPLGLDCVRRLHRAEIFPIIIFFCQSASSARKLRSKLHRHSLSEEQLLVCSKSEEPLLDKLPCLYHKVAPDLWCDQNSLLTKLRSVLSVEQRKIVWVEPDLW
ncbi:caspase recruitment domain-containing protein 14 isoform X2 [Entelurus aequoreus]|uniref:caspase recruitment domain-containing protein 14 isoform X2 n=1 Tax=Entelurus aequoreus TaxID=161455 RepID=UPI002B1D73F0|nr:caspase recruitment domain-containing protein 14 isoform X2 [Entelurus aequoreus]